MAMQDKRKEYIFLPYGSRREIVFTSINITSVRRCGGDHLNYIIRYKDGHTELVENVDLTQVNDVI